MIYILRFVTNDFFFRYHRASRNTWLRCYGVFNNSCASIYFFVRPYESNIPLVVIVIALPYREIRNVSMTLLKKQNNTCSNFQTALEEIPAGNSLPKKIKFIAILRRNCKMKLPLILGREFQKLANRLILSAKMKKVKKISIKK